MSAAVDVLYVGDRHVEIGVTEIGVTEGGVATFCRLGLELRERGEDCVEWFPVYDDAGLSDAAIEALLADEVITEINGLAPKAVR